MTGVVLLADQLARELFGWGGDYVQSPTPSYPAAGLQQQNAAGSDRAKQITPSSVFDRAKPLNSSNANNSINVSGNNNSHSNNNNNNNSNGGAVVAVLSPHARNWITAYDRRQAEQANMSFDSRRQSGMTLNPNPNPNPNPYPNPYPIRHHFTRHHTVTRHYPALPGITRHYPALHGITRHYTVTRHHTVTLAHLKGGGGWDTWRYSYMGCGVLGGIRVRVRVRMAWVSRAACVVCMLERGRASR